MSFRRFIAALFLLAPLALGACHGSSAATDAGPADADPFAPDAAPPDAGSFDAMPPPWWTQVERCGNGTDDDHDGLIDEDCPPSLFAGAFVPGAGSALGAGGVAATIEADAKRPLAVIQTYHATSAAGVAAMPPDLAGIFVHGAVAHFNLEPSGYSKAQYAAADTDGPIGADLAAAGSALAGVLASNPNGRVILTFAAEMNGDWTDWGCLPPATYIAFYRRAHDVVTASLAAESPPIDPRRVRWAYGPNNVSAATCGSAVDYFPGEAYVDLVGMSAYRSGTESVDTAVLLPAQAMLDGLGWPQPWITDRFVVLQTGTRDIVGDDRGAWISELYQGTRGLDPYAGVIYFDDSDWALLTPGAAGPPPAPPVPQTGYSAWIAAISALPVWSPRLDGLFAPYFWDVGPAEPEFAEIQSARAAGLTSGCAAVPPQFCPLDPLTRRDAAVLLARAFGISPAAGPPRFSDVPATDSAFGAIQALAARGTLHACATGTFCPDSPITRGDLAAALAMLAISSIPQFESDGTLDPCAPADFCLSDMSLRGVGTAWIVRAAGLPPAPLP